MGKRTNQEILSEAVAIFHLEGMDTPFEEQQILLKHMDNGTLDVYIKSLIEK